MCIYIYILLIWHDDPKCAPIIWAAHGLADDMAHCYSCLQDTYSGWLANCWLQPVIKTILISAEAEDASSSFPKAVGGNGKLRSCEWKLFNIYTGMNLFGKSLFVDMFRGLTLIEFHGFLGPSWLIKREGGLELPLPGSLVATDAVSVVHSYHGSVLVVQHGYAKWSICRPCDFP